MCGYIELDEGKEQNMRSKKEVGLSVLRMLMCFEVVLCHFWNDTDYSIICAPFHFFQSYALPVFMMLAFYLSGEKMLKCDCGFVRNRMCRLIVPHIAWTIIYAGVLSVIGGIFGTDLLNWKDAIWQLFTGHSPRINPSMWYQIMLIVLTLVYTTIFYYMPRKGYVVVCMLLIFAYMLQYTGINYEVFFGMRYELPIGRLCEMIPFATVGVLGSRYGFKQGVDRRLFYLCAILLVCAIVFDVEPLGFGYAGVRCLFVAMLMIVVALAVPSDKLPVAICERIHGITDFTLGIYCMHRLVGLILVRVLEQLGIETGTFLMCCYVYVICYMCCLAVSKIPISAAKLLVK